MKLKKALILLASAMFLLGATGCHKEPASTIIETESESETETTTETETESESETETEKQTEKETKKETERKSTAVETEKQTAAARPGTTGTTTGTAASKPSATQPTTVKPSSPTDTAATRPAASTQSYETDTCPYCGNEFYLANNTYADHVAQEESWIAYMASIGQSDTTGNSGYTDNSSDAGSGYQDPDPSAQCPYCYGWFTINDGSMNYHLQAEAAYAAENAPAQDNVDYDDVTYLVCPYCGVTYPEGPAYPVHYCE